MTKQDKLFNAAADFIENSGSLPDGLTARDRFIFIAGALRHNHQISCEADERSKENEKRLDAGDERRRAVRELVKIVVLVLGGLGTLVGILAATGVF